MNVDEYQDTTLETAIYPGRGTGSRDAILYAAVGMVGEAGEALEVIKKLLRGDFDPAPQSELRPDQAHTSYAFRERLKAELGDVAWYWNRLADELGYHSSDILADNLEKLRDRTARGVVQGSGNDR